MAKFSPAQAALALIFAPSAIQAITSLYPPFQSGVARKAFGETPNLVPTPSDLIGQRQKGLISDSDYVNLMEQAGYAPAIAERMLGNAKAYLSPLDYITAWRRSFITEEALDEALREQGFTTTDISTLKLTTIYYPTPQDLVRFGVRDVFTTATVKQYGLDNDYPDALDVAAEKAGLTSEISHQYWQAHWFLPSNNEIFDMLHRGIIDAEAVSTFLRVNDMMPFWRDKMIALSYDPITRVDVRRIYGLGLLTEEEVTRRYQDIGYSPDDAALLTRFTVEEAKHTSETTTTSLIVNSYKAGTVDRATALVQLQTAKVTIDLANTLLDNADSAINEELIGLEADAITDQYQQGHINLDEYQTQLTKIGVPARMLQLTIQRELAQARKRMKNSTKADLDTWWKTGVIGTTIYSLRMTALGYDKANVTKYLSELELGEIAGVDKKYTWAEPMRQFSDGNLLADGLQNALTPLVKNQYDINRLISIAQTLKS